MKTVIETENGKIVIFQKRSLTNKMLGIICEIIGHRTKDKYPSLTMCKTCKFIYQVQPKRSEERWMEAFYANPS